MKRAIFLFTTATCLCFALIGISQAKQVALPGITPAPDTYRSSAVILLDGQILGGKYFEEEKPGFFIGNEGTLTVASVSSKGGCSMPINNVPFQVAIRNGRTNTLFIYTREDVMSLNIDPLLQKCENGDMILILTSDQEYALPRNEIRVVSGC